MAVGGVFSGKSSVANNAYLTIQPAGTAGTAEATIHNLYWDGTGVSIELYDGSTSLIFDTDVSAGGRVGMVYHVTNTLYLRVKNTSGSTMNIGFDGVYSA